MKNFIYLAFACLLLVMFSCEKDAELLPKEQETSNEISLANDDIAMYYMGDKSVLTQLTNEFKIIYASPEVIENLEQEDSKYLLIVNGDCELDADVLKNIKKAGNPIVMINNAKAAKSILAMDIFEFDIDQPDGEMILVDGCMNIGEETTSYTANASDILEAVKGAKRWAIDILQKTSDMSKTESWTQVKAFNLSYGDYTKGKVNVRTKVHKAYNDGSSTYDYFLYEHDCQMSPSISYSSYSACNEYMYLGINAKSVVSDGYLDTYQPINSTQGATQYSIGFGISAGIGASGIDFGGTYTKSWTYTMPDVERYDYSRYQDELFHLDWRVNPSSTQGRTTFTQRPGCIIRQSSGRTWDDVMLIYNGTFRYTSSDNWRAATQIKILNGVISQITVRGTSTPPSYWYNL